MKPKDILSRMSIDELKAHRDLLVGEIEANESENAEMQSDIDDIDELLSKAEGAGNDLHNT